ncbi:MAG: hypothetical protein ABR604_07445, partial [Jatrophihabitantaceae bacterium]
MSEQPHRHGAEQAGQSPVEDGYSRPPGVDDGFGPRAAEPDYRRPPLTVSPLEQAVFGRPEGAAEFAPLPGERIPPHRTEVWPVPRAMSEAFGPTAAAAGGFDPAPGTRINPSRPAESPWWKADARRDPWRDPKSPYWLGRGAVFTSGRPSQVDPDQDAVSDDEPIVEVPVKDEPRSVAASRLGLRAVLVMLVVGLVAGGLGGGVGFWLTKHVRDSLHRSDVSLAKV